MGLFNSFLEIFWSEKFWLPANLSWKDIEPGKNGINYAEPRSLLWSIPGAIFLICLRQTFEKKLFKPLGRSLKIKEERESPPKHNDHLEKAYQRNAQWTYSEILKLSKQIDWSDREVEKWWRQRKEQDKPIDLNAFATSCWKAVYYIFMFSFGVYALWNESYFWNYQEFSRGFPHHSITNLIWWETFIAFSFYFSLLLTHFFDYEEKDFWQMFAHHIAGLSFGFIMLMTNFHVAAAVVAVIHDIADIFLEVYRILKLLKHEKTSDIFFAIFMIVWIISRLIVFPKIIISRIFYPETSWPSYNVTNFVFVVILIFHIIWTVTIVLVVKKKLGAASRVLDSTSKKEKRLSPEAKRLRRLDIG